jgi:hypothetical protein
MPKIQWLHYAENPVALLCRNPIGSLRRRMTATRLRTAREQRSLLGLKDSLNEYELDLLRQRSLKARRVMPGREELLVMAPVGFRNTDEQRLEKDPDRRVQEAIRLVFDQFERIGSVRQTCCGSTRAAIGSMPFALPGSSNPVH